MGLSPPLLIACAFASFRTHAFNKGVQRPFYPLLQHRFSRRSFTPLAASLVGEVEDDSGRVPHGQVRALCEGRFGVPKYVGECESGTSASVFEAETLTEGDRDGPPCRFVQMKVLSLRKLPEGWVSLDRLKQEKEVLEALADVPNTPRLVDWIQEDLEADTLFCLVAEKPAGRSLLEEVLTRGPLPAALAWRIVQRLHDTLDGARGKVEAGGGDGRGVRKVSHGRLTPENLFVDFERGRISDPLVTVAGWGAEPLDTGSDPLREEKRRRRDLQQAADLIYFMLTGKVGARQTDLLRLVQSNPDTLKSTLLGVASEWDRGAWADEIFSYSSQQGGLRMHPPLSLSGQSVAAVPPVVRDIERAVTTARARETSRLSMELKGEELCMTFDEDGGVLDLRCSGSKSPFAGGDPAEFAFLGLFATSWLVTVGRITFSVLRAGSLSGGIFTLPFWMAGGLVLRQMQSIFPSSDSASLKASSLCCQVDRIPGGLGRALNWDSKTEMISDMDIVPDVVLSPLPPRTPAPSPPPSVSLDMETRTDSEDLDLSLWSVRQPPSAEARTQAALLSTTPSDQLRFFVALQPPNSSTATPVAKDLSLREAAALKVLLERRLQQLQRRRRLVFQETDVLNVPR
uniref:Protein kinase domain-containing protein n=1 Tax=Chromera velia CCMP2878 TaxID=1169474 RepID=A0A0G4HS05_9ALVE|eukprot:Cvel_8224.t1-p1 / transcript=Cvel_8224.t1 / gene=Cvel_8224 / organism=Chromera_velia_CCMP2878 / gene_product=hypothetical protein / transcript_product=hypothetical protein / location=Cvel_scaffold449:14066-24618(+) / protein_length=627 / sequence_SO=supercontig / SO=protein_coding / is_pseudo=false